MAPRYISILCDPENTGLSQSTLRTASISAIEKLTERKRKPNIMARDQAFGVSGPNAWNKLPQGNEMHNT